MNPALTRAPLSLKVGVWLSGIVLVAAGLCGYLLPLALRAAAGSGDDPILPQLMMFPAVLVAAALVAIAALILVYREVELPLKRFAKAAEGAARGEPHTAVALPSVSELDRLGEALRRMTEELQRTREESGRWPQELEQKVARKTEELSQAQRQMAHMERLASLGKLAAAVAHELNNPLSAILMYARLVERELPEGGFEVEKRDELRRFLTQIQKDASRCGDVVRNLLLFARTPGADFALHRLNQIIERSLNLVRHRLEMARIEVEVRLLEEDVAISCDADQLQQALVSLLVNTAESMPDGGHLALNASPAENAVLIDIAGGGAPTAPTRIAHSVEPLWSGNGEEGTVGLGLPVVFGIVQRHGGRIEIGSEPDAGVTFRIVLPQATVGAASP